MSAENSPIEELLERALLQGPGCPPTDDQTEPERST